MRKADVTASDIGAVVGAHPYKTSLGLWAEKAGMFDDVEENDAMRRGRWLEPAVIEAVRDTQEWIVDPANEYLRAPEFRIGATPDALITNIGEEHKPDRIGVLQCKTVARPVYETEWEDGPPLYYQLQTLTEAMLANVEWAVLAALVIDTFNVELKIFDVPRHKGAEAKLIEAVGEFWKAVEAGVEPKADYDRDLAVLKQMRPPSVVSSIDLTTDNMLPHLLETREMLIKRRGDCQKGIDAIDAEVIDKLRGRQAGTLPGWKITHKTQKRKETVLPATEFPVLRITRSKSE